MVVLVRSDAAGAEVAEKLWITIMMSGRPAAAAMVAVTAMMIAKTVEVWVKHWVAVPYVGCEMCQKYVNIRHPLL